MAATSKYIQLFPGVLVEYIYTDPMSPLQYSTATKGIVLLNDSYLGTNYLFSNATNATDLGNITSVSAVSLNNLRTSMAYLKPIGTTTYLDYDDGVHFTPYPLVPATFSPAQTITYDAVRLHFESGYSFDGFDGFVLEVTVQRKDGPFVNLSSLVQLKSDSTDLNPEPFFVGQRLFTNYIEFNIPALAYFKNDNILNPNTLLYQLTEGKGLKNNPQIRIDLEQIKKTTSPNGFKIFEIGEKGTAFLDAEDSFSNLVADIQLASNGDYFELQGLYNGENYANFIASLNAAPNANYFVLHQIVVKEQLGINYVTTTDQTITQTANFDLPTLFRPVILNSATAVSFAISYTMRLINQVDGSQIVRYASLSNSNPKTYGRRLVKLNLGVSPTIAKVYNKVLNDTGSNITIQTTSVMPNQPVGAITIKREFVTNYKTRVKVRAKVSPATVSRIDQPTQASITTTPTVNSGRNNNINPE
jgi:hypothetical protein